MNNYQIEVVEPSAIPVLEDLERRKMIKLRPGDPSGRFRELVERIRAKGSPLSLDEITAEVDAVRNIVDSTNQRNEP